MEIVCPIFVDGSFCRKKELPDDIDIVLDGLAAPPEKHWPLAALCFRRSKFKETYHVDVWARLPLLPHDLSVFFQYVGDKAAAELQLEPKHPKGILRVLP